MGKYRSPPSSALPTAGLRGGLLPQNRSRREALYVVAVIVVACFCIWRICQFGAGVPQANTVMAVIQSTQVRLVAGFGTSPAPTLPVSVQ